MCVVQIQSFTDCIQIWHVPSRLCNYTHFSTFKGLWKIRFTVSKALYVACPIVIYCKIPVQEQRAWCRSQSDTRSTPAGCCLVGPNIRRWREPQPHVPSGAREPPSASCSSLGTTRCQVALGWHQDSWRQGIERCLVPHGQEALEQGWQAHSVRKTS